MKPLRDVLPVGSALAEAWRRGYTWADWRKDAAAALTVSLVALPLAMALAIAVGLPPQHGLYTAIIAGLVSPLLGGSRFQVSGPTAAFVVILAPIVSEHGLRGLIWTTLLAGVILIVLGMAKFGRYINYVPYPVTTGFTAGIAVVIGTLALNDFLGLGIQTWSEHYVSKLGQIGSRLPSLQPGEALVGGVALLSMALSQRWLRRVPGPVVGIGLGTLCAQLLAPLGIHVATIGNRFHYALPDGGTGNGIPPFAPILHWPGSAAIEWLAWPTWAELQVLAVPALVVAALAALESLLSAAVADGMAGTRHNPNAELIGLGIGNLLSGLAGGIPATGAIARTATNIQSGARSPLAASMHALLILVYVVLLAPWMSAIPMATLAALLIMVAYRMSHWRQFVHMVQVAPRSDTWVLVACFGFTVFVDMVAGVAVGVVLASFLLVKRLADLTQANVSHGTSGRHKKLDNLDLPEDTMVYHLNGSLFFASVERAFERTGYLRDAIQTLIIDVEEVPFIDMTGLVAMRTMILDVQAKGRAVVLCGSPPLVQQVLKELPEASRAQVRSAPSVQATLKMLRVA
ncbi:MAG: STAS domain-containing protein [Planctomycetes bacterium]|nr:STAS domain-containing protein [Planctomycetota bacterium]MCB9909896.1 STAS domain-containing protein [Planctomycetota bacterium]